MYLANSTFFRCSPHMKKFILITNGVFVSIIGLTLLLLVTGIIWKSPSRFVNARSYTFQTPVTGMTECGGRKDTRQTYSTHPIYTVTIIYAR